MIGAHLKSVWYYTPAFFLQVTSVMSLIKNNIPITFSKKGSLLGVQTLFINAIHSPVDSVGR